MARKYTKQKGEAMKKVLIMLLLIGVNLYANLNDDGMAEFQKGNYQKASQLWKKACDGGN